MNALFLQLIQPFPGRLDTIKGNDLLEMRAASLKADLFPLAYSQLQKYQNSASPKERIHDFLQDSRSLYLRCGSMSVRQEAVEDEIIGLLSSKGIPAAVIKGNAIAKEIYGDPNCRVSSDLDILIRKTDAGIVHEILLGAGYSTEKDLPLAYCLSRIHHASYRHPLNNMLVEIHWGFGISYFFNLTSEDIWKEVTRDDSERLHLSPEMLLIMLLIHHHSHAFRELKILVDILWTLHKYDKIFDWHMFADRLRMIGLFRSACIALCQIQSLWNDASREIKAIAVLREEIEKMGAWVPMFLVSYFQMDLAEISFHRYKDKLMARFALDRWSTIIFSYPRTLFPVPEAIKELYHDQRTLTLPLNYLKFIRWRIGEWLKG